MAAAQKKWALAAVCFVSDPQNLHSVAETETWRVFWRLNSSIFLTGFHLASNKVRMCFNKAWLSFITGLAEYIGKKNYSVITGCHMCPMDIKSTDF